MSGLSITHHVGRAVSIADGDTELLRYDYRPDTAQLESPKPYVHPLRTRAGHLVSLFRPHDHVWHKGIAWSLPVVGDENFWGGPTYMRDHGYVQLPNNGTQQHTAVRQLEVDPGGSARLAHDLDWITQGGARIFTERRALIARVIDEGSWALTFESQLTNVTDAAIAIGSPTTKGRQNAGYGGLFWRGPRSFTGGTLVTAAGRGSGDDVRGQRHEWMAFAGRHDESDAPSTVVMVDHVDNPHHPPQWFARSEEFAALNPAPFFSEEVVVPAGDAVTFRYGTGIGDSDADDAERLASAVRAVLTAEFGSTTEVGSTIGEPG